MPNQPTNKPHHCSLGNLGEKGHCCLPVPPEALSIVLLSHRMPLSLPRGNTPCQPARVRSQRSWGLSSSPFASPKFPCASEHCCCALHQHRVTQVFCVCHGQVLPQPGNATGKGKKLFLLSWQDYFCLQSPWHLCGLEGFLWSAFMWRYLSPLPRKWQITAVVAWP